MSSRFDTLSSLLRRFPGIGKKSAERLAFYILALSEEEANSFLKAFTDFRAHTGFCKICGLMSENNPCRICQSNKRDRSIICVVKDVQDALAIERSGGYNGLYHVLGGVISPVKNIYEKDLFIETLLKRITNNVKEIIFAMEQTVEADATVKLICSKPEFKRGISVSRLAIGIPTGTGIEHIDETTLNSAVRNRYVVSG